MKKLNTFSLLSGLGFALAISTAVGAGGNPPVTSQPVTGANTFPMPAFAGPRIPLSAQSVVPPVPRVSVSKSKRARFERRTGLGNTLADQWAPDKDLPSELRPGGLNPSERDDNQASLTV